MSMFDKLKGMMGVPDDDDYEDEGVDMMQNVDDTDNYNDYNMQDNYGSSDGSPKRNKVVNINSTMQLQVVLVKPERFDDASACLLYTSRCV